MKHFFRTRAPLALALITAAAIAACSDDSTGPVSATPAAVAAANTPPASPQVALNVPGPSVTVTDASGNPVSGAVVNFDVTAGGGSVQYPTATTNESGVASSGLWRIGPKIGVNTVSATVEGVAPVTFSVTSVPGPASQLAIVSGQLQHGAPGSNLPLPLSASVTDAGGNPRAGEAVTFTVLTGGGSIPAAAATTNAQGIANSGTWTLGPCPQSIQTVRASSGALQATFTGSSRETIATGGTANGALEATDCTIGGSFADQYELSTPGSAVTISLASSAFDALLNVSDSAGNFLIVSNDNDPSAGTNAALTRLIVGPGMNTLTATSATPGATGAYTLSVAAASSNVTDCTPAIIALGATTNQTLTTSDCTTHNGDNGDGFLVWLPAGVPIRITQTSSPLDALIELYSPAGVRLVKRDNFGVGGVASNEIINFTATTAGFYKIVATSYGLVDNDPYGAEYGAYTLSVIVP